MLENVPAVVESAGEEPKLLTPKDRILVSPIETEAILNVYHGRQFLQIRTPWGWIAQRDDGVAFTTIGLAVDSVKPKPVISAPSEPVPVPEETEDDAA